MMAKKMKRVLVVGLGNMGMSHALAYTRISGLEVVGVCDAHIDKVKLSDALGSARKYSDYDTALGAGARHRLGQHVPDTHADYSIKAMEAGAHVFVEKPLAETVERAEDVVETAKRTGRKLVIGYILRVHPSWIKFIEIARKLGTPLVFRMNLNQQSNGETWAWHKRLMESFPPIVDCGVHYVDVMCQMTEREAGARAGDGARTAARRSKQYNYGVLQVAFDDGSVGWYEAGWGPMMSETAFFVKDVIGPKGSVSIVMAENAAGREIRRHQRPHQDQPDPLASCRHVEAATSAST